MEIDGNLVNAATIFAGFISTFVRPVRKRVWKHTKCWAADKAITDFLNGASSIPFMCLFASAFYPSLTPLVVGNQGPMAVAGAIGSIFIVGEVLSAGRDERPEVA